MILTISGSGRSRGNCAELLRAAMGGAAVSGDVVSLAELSFRGCVGCRACRESSEVCVLRDDLSSLLRATASADALLLATPIYYAYASGLFKSYLDRWYSFRSGSRTLRVREGRPALLIVTQGHPDPSAYSWTVQSLEKVLASYGLRLHTLVAAGVEGPDDAAGRPDLQSEARRLGALLRA